MGDEAWQRAHSPAQKEQRRAAIFKAAAELFRERPIADITIGEVAARAGLAKGSVYRYFGTKEEVFLGLLLDDLVAWFEDLRGILAPLGGAGDGARVAALVVKSLRKRERMLRLLSRLPSDIEQNLSLDAARDFKRWLLAQLGPPCAAIEAALPSLPPGQGWLVVRRLYALVAGLWPMAHPVGNMKKVLTSPRMAPHRVDFYAELEGTLAAMLIGMAGGASRAEAASAAAGGNTEDPGAGP